MHDGVFRPPLPQQERRERHQRDRQQHADERRGQPVVFLPLVQRDVQAAHPHGQERQPHKVDARRPAMPHVRRILHEHLHQRYREDPDRQVDVEHPSPRVIVGDPPAQRRPDDRRDHHTHAENRHRHAAFGRLETFQKHRLADGLHRPAAKALNDPRHDQERQRRRRSACDGGQREDHDAPQQQPLPSQQAAQPACGRDDNGVGHQVARQRPGRLIRTGREGARDVRQGHRHHRAVQHDHERRRHHRRRDQPGMGLRPPGLQRNRRYVRR